MNKAVVFGRMFIAGLIPGALLALGFVMVIVGSARFAPSFVFTKETLAKQAAPPVPQVLMGKAEMMRKLTPIILLVIFVLGGLYSGFFTPTEAGGVGAFAALVIAVLRKSLNLQKTWAVMTQTGSISVGILVLLVAAGFYGQMLAVAGIPSAIGDLVRGSGFGAYGFLFIYVILVLVLGMILDSTSILLILVPIAAPIAQGLGFDLIHFGIISVIAVEVGLLTPPFGISIFTVHATLSDKDTTLESIFGGALPYVGVMVGVMVLIAAFPWLVIG